MPTMRTDRYGLYEGDGAAPYFGEDWDGTYHPDYVSEQREYWNNRGPGTPYQSCVLKCFAERMIICGPFMTAGSGCGVLVTGIATIPSGGASLSAFRLGAAIGGASGRGLCQLVMFDSSCSSACQMQLGSELAP